MTRWGIVADLNRCVGCQTCTAACKHANATSPGIQWRKVLDVETGAYPDVRRAFVPVGCVHCDDPPCLDVCPTTATGKRDDGIVTIDYDLCIGCAYCVVACPYQARSRVDGPAAAYGKKPMRHEARREDPRRIDVAQKCTLCVERIDFGMANGLMPGIDPAATPACVSTCIADALHFGDLDDPDSNVSKLLVENRHFRMHEDLGTGPGFFYLWDKARDEDKPVEDAAMVADPAGMAAVSPRLQQSWDWRAAANFIFGGAGSGLFVASATAALAGVAIALPALMALALVGLGLFCVWLEIGRPWRFIHVYFHARRSWMTREAIAALPFFGFGLAAVITGSAMLALVGAAFGLAFLYCQARILQAAKGIPAWRQRQIVPLMVATGLTEGLGLFAIYAAVSGVDGSILKPLALALVALIGLRHLAWRSYRRGLGAQGAPTATFKVLDTSRFNLSLGHQLLPAGILVASLMTGPLLPILLAVTSLFVVASGWAFKYTLITQAAFNQGYAVERMPARGAGDSAPGIKPGWTFS
jgi:Fe-S-cluster-containing dehydrogenase component/DMSO reductase anchor subunit